MSNDIEDFDIPKRIEKVRRMINILESKESLDFEEIEFLQHIRGELIVRTMYDDIM